LQNGKAAVGRVARRLLGSCRLNKPAVGRRAEPGHRATAISPPSTTSVWPLT
jgi:hypothetical protein